MKLYTLELTATEISILDISLANNIKQLEQLGCTDVATQRRKLHKKVQHLSYATMMEPKK